MIGLFDEHSLFDWKKLLINIQNKNINDLTELSIKENIRFFKNLKLTGQEEEIAHQILKEGKQRLEFLNNV